MSDRPYKEAVDCGVAWLGVVYPDWRDRVRPNKLRMEQASWCVLGLASGVNYFRALTKHGLTGDDAVRMGFTAGPEAPTAEFYALADEWRGRLTPPPGGSANPVPESFYKVRRADGRLDSTFWHNPGDPFVHARLQPGDEVLEFPGASARVVSPPKPKLSDLLAALAADPPAPVTVRGTRWGGSAALSGQFTGQLVGLTAGDAPTEFSVKLKAASGALSDVRVEVVR